MATGTARMMVVPVVYEQQSAAGSIVFKIDDGLADWGVVVALTLATAPAAQI